MDRAQRRRRGGELHGAVSRHRRHRLEHRRQRHCGHGLHRDRPQCRHRLRLPGVRGERGGQRHAVGGGKRHDGGCCARPAHRPCGGHGNVSHHAVDMDGTGERRRGGKLFGALVAAWREHLDHGCQHLRHVDHDQRPHCQHVLRFRGRGGERRRQQRLVGGDHCRHGQRAGNYALSSGFQPLGGGTTMAHSSPG